MKILIDARLYGLENAGLGRYVMNLVDELASIDKGNDYVVLLRNKYFKELKLPKNWKKVLADINHYSISEQIKLPIIISAEAVDMVHFPHLNVPLTFKGKFVVTIHDIVMNKFKGAETTNLSLPLYLAKRVGYKKVFEKAVKESVKIIVPSEFTKRELATYYKVNEDKIVVTYEGVETKKVSKANPANILESYGLLKPYFLYVGNAYPHKNLKRAVKAITEYNLKHADKVQLAIVSSRNVFTSRLEEIIKEADAQDFIKLLGFVPDDKLAVLYRKAEAYLFPSLYEGFGLPGLEAMSSECLLLASEIPVFKEIYKDNATYFNPFDSNSIEAAIRDVVVMDKKKKVKIIRNAKTFANKYSWKKMAKETLKVYKEVASSS